MAHPAPRAGQIPHLSIPPFVHSSIPPFLHLFISPCFPSKTCASSSAPASSSDGLSFVRGSRASAWLLRRPQRCRQVDPDEVPRRPPRAERRGDQQAEGLPGRLPPPGGHPPLRPHPAGRRPSPPSPRPGPSEARSIGLSAELEETRPALRSLLRPPPPDRRPRAAPRALRSRPHQAAHRVHPRRPRLLSATTSQRDCGEFSGGWQMRIAMAKLFLQEPEVLLLDEPTNHLDVDAQRWMESFLRELPRRHRSSSPTTSPSSTAHHPHHRLPQRGQAEEYAGNYSFYQGARPAAQEHPRASSTTPSNARSRRPSRLDQPLPRQGHQGLPGPEPHQAARERWSASSSRTRTPR